MVKDYYYILGVSKTASTEEIKKAFRKLSLKFHPDKNEGDSFFEERFKEINEAYGILSDQKKRADYDRVIAETVPGYTPPPKPPTPEPPKSTPPPPEPPKPPTAPIKEKTDPDSSAPLFIVVFIFIAFALIFLLPQKKQEYSGPALSYDTPQREQSEPVVVDAPDPAVPPAEVDMFREIQEFKFSDAQIIQLKKRDINIEKYQKEINEDIAAGGERKNIRIFHTYKLLDLLSGGTYYSELLESSVPIGYTAQNFIDKYKIKVELGPIVERYLVLVIEYFDTTTKENAYDVSNVLECSPCNEEQIIRIKDQLQSTLLPWKQYTGYKYFHFNDYSSASIKKDQLLAGY